MRGSRSTSGFQSLKRRRLFRLSNTMVSLRLVSIFSTRWREDGSTRPMTDRKSTRLNSSHVKISYAVFCLKKKTRNRRPAGHDLPGVRAAEPVTVRLAEDDFEFAQSTERQYLHQRYENFDVCLDNALRPM